MIQQRKVIRGEENSACEQWELPVVGESDMGGIDTLGIRTKPLTASQLEAVYRQAREEGLAEGRKAGEKLGYQAGIMSGKAEVESRIEKFKSLISSFSAPLDNLDSQVEESLVSLAMSVARHLVRRELKIDPGQVVAVVRDAMKALPVASPRVELHLHPEDARLVREIMVVSDTESKWRVIEEPMLTRGGCRIITETSQIDATVENRVAAVVAKVMGEEREGDQLP
ncbi:MAG: flagellar assembly protein FliH [Gammaproteobacteria bacterium]|nr:flagellar assembly protein FliH [Gammaproteobacteria bacterium]